MYVYDTCIYIYYVYIYIMYYVYIYIHTHLYTNHYKNCLKIYQNSETIQLQKTCTKFLSKHELQI